MKIASTSLVDETAVDIELCIANYDFESQATRGFLFHFQSNQATTNDKSLKAVLKVSGTDLEHIIMK